MADIGMMFYGFAKGSSQVVDEERCYYRRSKNNENVSTKISLSCERNLLNEIILLSLIIHRTELSIHLWWKTISKKLKSVFSRKKKEFSSANLPKSILIATISPPPLRICTEKILSSNKNKLYFHFSQLRSLSICMNVPKGALMHLQIIISETPQIARPNFEHSRPHRVKGGIGAKFAARTF